MREVNLIGLHLEETCGASGGPGFGVAGVPLARDSALLEAGFDLRLTPNATLGVSYLGQFASTVDDHAVRGKLVWNF